MLSFYEIMLAMSNNWTYFDARYSKPSVIDSYLLFEYELLHEGLSTSPIGGPCVESRRKADDLMMVCAMREVAGDLHAALLCCNQAACTKCLSVI